MRRFLSVLFAVLMSANMSTAVFAGDRPSIDDLPTADDLRAANDLRSYAILYRQLRAGEILGEDFPFLYWVMMTERSKALEANDLEYSDEWGFMPSGSLPLFLFHQCMVEAFFPDELLFAK